MVVEMKLSIGGCIIAECGNGWMWISFVTNRYSDLLFLLPEVDKLEGIHFPDLLRKQTYKKSKERL